MHRARGRLVGFAGVVALVAMPAGKVEEQVTEPGETTEPLAGPS